MGDLAENGRLHARPGSDRPGGGADAAASSRSRVLRLGLDKERDALLYIPRGYRADQAAPLVLVLHGAGGNAERGLNPLRPRRDAGGLLLLSPASRGRTWDIIVGRRYGPDVAFIDRALERVFDQYAIDPARIALSGFSDGGSYALSLGLMNGDLFRYIAAFSPGFMAPTAHRGMPWVYISHGTRDGVLPIDRCSRIIVPELRAAGYGVRYREVAGGHTVPRNIGQEAATWLSGKTV